MSPAFFVSGETDSPLPVSFELFSCIPRTRTASGGRAFC